MPDDTDQRVRRFIRDARAALAEYDRGYADPDATLQLLRKHIDDLDADLDGGEET